MLLEYTDEMDEMALGDRAIEIRKRVAGRHLNKAIEEGDVGINTLIEMKKNSKNQLTALTKDNIVIQDTTMSSRVHMHRANQHLVLLNDFRMMDRDVLRISTLGKAKIDTLNELEKRILLMRKKLMFTGESTIEEDMMNEVQASGKTNAVTRLYTICGRCDRKILTHLMETHTGACLKVFNIETITNDGRLISNSFNDLTTFLPQPPRHVKVALKGCTYIKWIWDPPVMNGGLMILDYEIKYQARITEIDEVIGKSRTTIQVVEPFKTSLWCIKNPIANHGYNMNGLLGGCEYFDFHIRSLNARGYSEWKAMLPADDEVNQKTNVSVWTDDPDPPTAPLFFTVTSITSSCIHLKWQPPLFDGGRAIAGYTISYIFLERQVTSGTREVIIEKPNIFKVKIDSTCLGGAVYAVIRNLPSATHVKDITCKARNKAGLFGQQCVAVPLEGDESVVYSTRAASRHQQIKLQLKNALQITENEPNQKHIDTIFLQGYQQRIGIDDFIRLLIAELSVTPEDQEEAHEEDEWLEIVKEKLERRKLETAAQEAVVEAVKNEMAQDDVERREETQRYVFNHLQRRAHFKIRMRELEERVARLQKESYFLDANRSELSLHMQRLQLRQIILNQECDRVRGYKGTMVTSSVLHGAEMKYEIFSFKKDIEAACEACAKDIASSKFKVIAGEDRKIQIKAEVVTAVAKLADRRAKFQLYMKSYEKNMKLQQCIFTSEGKQSPADPNNVRILKSSFNRLHSYSVYWRQVKATMLTRLRSKLKILYSLVFTKWCLRDLKTFGKKESLSAGSIYLNKVMGKREEMQRLLRETIADASSIRQQLEVVTIPRESRNKLLASSGYALMEEGMNHTELGRATGGLHLLYEGDGMTRAAKFDLACSLYEAQIISIRSRSQTCGNVNGRRIIPDGDIKLLAFTHGRLGKLFLLQHKLDRSLVEFDRQLSLALEVGDEAEMADAYLGMGSAYLTKGELDDAIRYLDTSQGKFLVVGNAHRQRLGLKALQECYERKYEPEIAQGYARQIDAIEGELGRKFSLMTKKLSAMTARLVKSSSADVEKSIAIERCTVYFLTLRIQIKSLIDSIPIIEEDLRKQQLRVNSQYKLLEDIDTELKEADETEASKMMSNLLLDMGHVMVDVEELKSRLGARRVTELRNLNLLKAELQGLDTSLLNVHDSIKQLNIDKDVEACDLMKRSQRERNFRCIAVDKANAAGDSILGKNTGGVETFVAAEGKNIRLFKFKTGELLNVFVGDDDTRVGKKVGHTKHVTCLVYDKETIFSGGVDELIFSWDIVNKSISKIFEGHEGSITAIATCQGLLVSASADLTTRLWDVRTGMQLRTLFGHMKSVLSLELGPDWLLTGSADEEARMWSVRRKSASSVSATTVQRLIGHEQPVTCVRYGALEVLTGDNTGRIFIWWMKTGQVIRMISAHKGPVRCMQFDSVHVVSGGVDNNVCIVDLATGEVMQTLRAHTNQVLFVGFDSARVMSLSSDNTMRLYKWGSSDSGPADKYHVLGMNESLVDVSRAVGASVEDIMRWNGIKDTRQLHDGMRLIVAKGDPAELSHAERVALEREHRMADKQLPADSKRSLLSAADAALLHPSRIHKLVTANTEADSLANRMFKQAKLDNDLFPSIMGVGENSTSLANRLQRNSTHPLVLNHLRPGFLITTDNEDEWGNVSDALMLAMMEVYVESEVFLEIKELIRGNASSESIHGRMRNGGRHPFKVRRVDDVSRELPPVLEDEREEKGS